MTAGAPAHALWLASLAATATATAQTAPAAAAAASAAAVEVKVSPLLGQVLDHVVPATRDGSSGDGGLFRRFALQHKAAQAPQGPRPAAILVPALGYAMEQLDPVSFAVLRPIPVAGSGALLRTGDVFVLQFSTSLPGQVRLENIDTRGKVADLGTYTVLVDQLNRLPRDKGIQLQGQPGLERLRFYFYPCLPVEAAGKDWAADFKGRLPACTTAPRVVLASSGTSQTYGAVAPRALVNLAQPDANLVFAGSHEYQPGEMTLMEAQIRHEGRGHGR